LLPVKTKEKKMIRPSASCLRVAISLVVLSLTLILNNKSFATTFKFISSPDDPGIIATITTDSNLMYGTIPVSEISSIYIWDAAGTWSLSDFTTAEYTSDINGITFSTGSTLSPITFTTDKITSCLGRYGTLVSYDDGSYTGHFITGFDQNSLFTEWNGGIFSATGTWVPVPEPSTLFILGAGLAGLGLTRMRTKS
jgi:hypothetical protein